MDNETLLLVNPKGKAILGVSKGYDFLVICVTDTLEPFFGNIFLLGGPIGPLKT